MKTMKSITAIALLFATALSFANNTNGTVDLKNTDSLMIRETDEPFFRRADGKLYMNFFNQDMEEVQIKVVDSENRVVFKQTLKDQLVVEKAFNFTNAEKDSYKVIIKGSQDTYYESYVVR